MERVILPDGRCPFGKDGGCEAFQVLARLVLGEIEHAERRFDAESSRDFDDRYGIGVRKREG
jgi:hypothetical protein